jgi:hypothetical protein
MHDDRPGWLERAGSWPRSCPGTRSIGCLTTPSGGRASTAAACSPTSRRVTATRLTFVKRGVEEPQLAFGVAGAVFADSVGLVGWFLDDVGAGLDAVGVVGVGVVN